MVNCVERYYQHNNNEDNGDDEGRLVATNLIGWNWCVAVQNGFVAGHVDSVYADSCVLNSLVDAICGVAC